MKASLRFHRKATLFNERTGEIAIAELKVFDVPKSGHYPEGIKYSLFLVLEETGKVLVGFDNQQLVGQGKIAQDRTFFGASSGSPIDHDNFVDRYFEKDIAQAKVKRIRFHDLRHTPFRLDIGP